MPLHPQSGILWCYISIQSETGLCKLKMSECSRISKLANLVKVGPLLTVYGCFL